MKNACKTVIVSLAYSQHARVDKEASIFSIGGSCMYSSTLVASAVFCPFFSSYIDMVQR